MAPLSFVVTLVAISTFLGAQAFKPVTFAVIGDWGWGPDGDYTKLPADKQPTYFVSQKAVAAGLGAICQKVGCEFVINNGDNFYDLGISKTLGVFDPQFKTSFDEIYNHSSLQKLKFYGVLGNHEYGIATAVNADVPTSGEHTIMPQLEYTSFDPKQRWYIPTRYYTARAIGRPGRKLDLKVQITAIDSSVYVDKYCLKPSAKYYTAELLYGCQENVRLGQELFAARSLRSARRTADWSIMVSHHPLYSPSEAAPTVPLNALFAPILNASNTMPQLWFNGHDHITAHFKHPEVPKTDFFTIGASGIAEAADLPAASIASSYPYSSPNNGFAIVKLYKTYGQIFMYGINMSDPIAAANPTNPTLQYSYTFQKNSA